MNGLGAIELRTVGPPCGRIAGDNSPLRQRDTCREGGFIDRYASGADHLAPEVAAPVAETRTSREESDGSFSEWPTSVGNGTSHRGKPVVAHRLPVWRTISNGSNYAGALGPGCKQRVCIINLDPIGH